MTHDDATGSATHGYDENREAHLRRLRRVEGQIRGIQRMVDEDKYCIDILTQISAATSALERVAVDLLEEHMMHCVVDAARQDPEAGRSKVDEAIAAISRLIKS